MKKGILFFIIIAILFSCNKNDDGNTPTEIVGNWKLVLMAGSAPNSGTTGSEMEWQENYLIKSDGTFQKSRDRNGVITEVSGKYTIINISNDRYLEFIFTGESEIIGSCYSNLKEEMFLQSDETFSSTWQNCDGPSLLYEKTN